MPSFSPASYAQTARRLTEAAARACGPWIGGDDKDAADAAAVAALRDHRAADGLRGTVVIGEGEKDDAPYLAPGTRMGPDGGAPRVDVAVDPLEGTRLVATNAPGALSVLALAPAGCLMRLGRAFYMEKLIGPPSVQGRLALDASPRAVVAAVAEAEGIPRSAVRVAVQERPRHAALVEALRDAGAQVRLFGDGDLSFALLALRERGAANGRTEAPIDLLWGIGGAPEGVLAAAAQRALGGAMRARPAPRSAAERTRLHDDPALPGVLDRTFGPRDLVQTDAVAMALTGVTDGPLLRGLRSSDGGGRTETLVLTPDAGARRVVASPDDRP
jgi:fructose-1,6-bisphosphatase II